MEATLDRTDRPRYLTAPTRPACEIDAAIAEMESLLTEPVFQQPKKSGVKAKREHEARMALMEVAAAALRWAREREADGELAGDWQAFLDICAANGERR